MDRLSPFLTSSRPYLADGGLETTLIFHRGIDLPSFASFVLYETEAGCQALWEYFAPYVALARKSQTGFVLDTATWRAGTRWGAVLGRDETAIRQINTQAVGLAKAMRTTWEGDDFPILINGCIGPCGDAYDAGRLLLPTEAEEWHRPQIEALAAGGADLVSALTLSHSGEAIGIARAATAQTVPVAISFTVETDGRLPSGESLQAAIAAVDVAAPGVLFYGINCAHPTHFADVLAQPWADRIGLLRANASRQSHAELDEAAELDDGDPVGLGVAYAALAEKLPGLRIIGGCCGTDHRHVGCAATGHRTARPD